MGNCLNWAVDWIFWTVKRVQGYKWPDRSQEVRIVSTEEGTRKRQREEIRRTNRSHYEVDEWAEETDAFSPAEQGGSRKRARVGGEKSYNKLFEKYPSSDEECERHREKLPYEGELIERRPRNQLSVEDQFCAEQRGEPQEIFDRTRLALSSSGETWLYYP